MAIAGGSVIHRSPHILFCSHPADTRWGNPGNSLGLPNHYKVFFSTLVITGTPPTWLVTAAHLANTVGFGPPDPYLPQHVDNVSPLSIQRVTSIGYRVDVRVSCSMWRLPPIGVPDSVYFCWFSPCVGSGRLRSAMMQLVRCGGGNGNAPTGGNHP